MNYSISLFFVASYEPESDEPPMWEEKIFLIHAETEADAQEISAQIAKNEEVEYTNSDGVRVRWSYVKTERIYPLDADIPMKNIEVFSRFLKNSEAVSILGRFDENE